jgi:ACR3 family arsenite efflux pump ArsB
MVFVWSSLVGGNAAYTLVQVALNDLLMLAVYIPVCAALIGATNLALPWDTIAMAVALFIAAPLALGATIRAVVVRRPGGKEALARAMNVFKPVTIVALLATLVLIFIFQGQKIGSKPLDIVLLAIPIVLQTLLNFCLAYYLVRAGCGVWGRGGVGGARHGTGVRWTGRGCVLPPALTPQISTDHASPHTPTQGYSACMPHERLAPAGLIATSNFFELAV